MTLIANRIKHFYERQASGYYDDVAAKAREKWVETLVEVGVDREAEINLKRIGELVAIKARVVDKISLFKSIIGDAIDVDGSAGGTLTDDDALMILAGWASEHSAKHYAESLVEDDA